MALQTSGAISISQIKTELSSTNNSLRVLSATAGFSTPDSMSEFYGYSAGEVNDYFWNYAEDENGTRYTANTPSTRASDHFSFSMWVRPSWASTDINVVLFDFVQDTNNRFFLSYDYGLNRFVWRYRSNGRNFDRQWAIASNVAATGTSGKWHGTNRGFRNSDNFVHLAGSYDGSQTNASNAFKLYWNAVEMSNQIVHNTNDKRDFTKEQLFIDVNGINSAADRDAEFDNIAFWKGRILSATDISAMYNGGTPATAAFVGQGNSLDFEVTFEGGVPDDTTSNWTLDYAGGNPGTY